MAVTQFHSFRGRRYAVLCLAALFSSSLLADTINYLGSEQQYTVSTSGVYDITLAGAQGGSGFDSSGGAGAVVSGDYSLSVGTVLDVFTGGQGASGVATGGGGGGGGTFIVFNSTSSLLAAAGGGGGGGIMSSGLAGQTTTAGGAGVDNGNTGGQNGQGGHSGNGGGGAGFSGNGGSAGVAYGNGGGGEDYTNGFTGGAGGSSLAGDGGDGGYGGGGGGSANGPGGGGGGGYSGGGGGTLAGGGGGSYDALLTDVSATAGGNTGNGYVTIDLVAAQQTVPEPASFALLVFGLLAIPAVRRLRQAPRQSGGLHRT